MPSSGLRGPSIPSRMIRFLQNWGATGHDSRSIGRSAWSRLRRGYERSGPLPARQVHEDGGKAEAPPWDSSRDLRGAGRVPPMREMHDEDGLPIVSLLASAVLLPTSYRAAYANHITESPTDPQTLRQLHLRPCCSPDRDAALAPAQAPRKPSAARAQPLRGRHPLNGSMNPWPDSASWT